MKQTAIILPLLILLFASFSFAATDQEAYRDQNVTIHNDENGVLLDMDLSNIQIHSIEAENDLFTTVTMEGEGFTYEKDMPILPIVSRFIVVPPTAGIELEVTHDGSVTVPAEHPPLLNREEFLGTALIGDNEDKHQGLYPPHMAELSNPTIIRGVRMVKVTTYPVQYDFDNNVYIHNQNVQAELRFTDDEPVNPVRNPDRHGYSREYVKFFDALVSNPEAIHRDDPDEDISPWAGHYCILAHNNCVNLARDFIEWRRKAGYLVDIVPTGGAENASKGAIQELYDSYVDDGEEPFDLLHIIGDLSSHQNCGAREQWIVHTQSGESVWANPAHADYKYSLLEGNDLHPDVGLSRWASGSQGLMELNIGRTRAYEYEPYMEDTDWFTHGGVGSTHWGNGENTAWHVSINTNVRWGKEVLEHLGYDDIDVYEDYDWDQRAARYGPWVRDLLNGRTNVVLSRAEVYYWRSDFNGINNNVVFPIRLNTSGHGEWATWHMTRTGNGNSLKGWVAATCGWGGPSTIAMNTVWLGLVKGVMNHDMPFGIGYSFAITYFEQFLPNFRFRNIPVYAEAKTDVDAYGEPGIQPWRGVPEVYAIDHIEEMTPETRMLEVFAYDPDNDDAPVEGARISLYVPGDLPNDYDDYAAHEVWQMTGFTDADGYARFVFEEGNEFDADEMYVTLTGRDLHPIFGEIEITQPNTTLDLANYTLEETEGDGAETVSPGETFNLNITATNRGRNGDADAVTAVVSSVSPWVEVEENELELGDIPHGEEVNAEDAVVIHIHESCPDGVARRSQRPVLRVDFTSGDNTWYSGIELNPVAPNFQVNSVVGGTVIDTELREVDISLENIGRMNSGDIRAELVSMDMGVGVVESEAEYSNIRSGRSERLANNTRFSLSGNSVVVPGFINPMMLVLTTESGFVDTARFTLQVDEPRRNAPGGPDNYGYICFDDTDDDWDVAPDYEWIEISEDERDRDFDGVKIDDFNGESERDVGETVTIDLPFETQFYGEIFDQISICTNGYICFGDQEYITNFQNWPMDQAIAGGAGMAAPFWDRLDYNNNESGIYYYYDEDDARFIIEWYNMTIKQDNDELTFQVILYDHEVWITETGDQNILFQYHDISQARGPVEGNPEHEKNIPYASVGISSPDGTTGINYTYANDYPVTSAPLQSRRAILFSTSPRYKACTIYGHVKDEANDEPIESCVVVTEQGFTAITDEEGNYWINGALAEVPFDITARIEGYNDSTKVDFEVAEDDTVEINFSLLHPEFTPSVDDVEDGLQEGNEAIHEFDVTNTGNGPLYWSVTRELRGDANADPWEWRQAVDVSEITGDSRVQGALFIGDYFYVASSHDRDPQIYVINRDHEIVDQFPQIDQEGTYGYKDMAWDGEWIWASGSDNVYAFDLEGNLMLEFDGPWNPNNNFAWDSRNEVMWISSTTSDIVAVDREGNDIRELDRQGMRVYGLSYFPEDPDGYYLYMMHKDSELGDHMVVKMNPENGDTTLVEVLDEVINQHGGGRPISAQITNQFDVYSWVLLETVNDGANDRITIWQVDVRRDWVNVEPTSGTINTEESQEFTVTFNSTGLPAEVDFVADLVYRHNAEGLQTLIPVTLSVLPEGPVIEERVLEIEEGWGMISLNVDPENRDVPTILQPLVDQEILELFKDGRGRFYLPEHNFCNIPEWAPGMGFQILMSEAGELTVEGMPIPEDEPITMTEGWNLKAYYPRVAVDAVDALANIREHLVIAKDENGRFYLPEHNFSNMGNMVESSGYQFNVSQDLNLIYNIPEEGQVALAAVEREQYSYYTSPIPTSSNMSLLIEGNRNMAGWEIAAVSPDGQVVGAGSFDSHGRCGLAVWGDDELTDIKEGLIDGEAFTLKVWDGSFEMKADLFAKHGEMSFTANDILVGDISISNIPDKFELTGIYPNPFNAVTRINFAVPQQGNVQLAIFDLAGREVTRLVSGEMKAGYHAVTWNGAAITSGVYFARLSWNGQVQVAKVTLIK